MLIADRLGDFINDIDKGDCAADFDSGLLRKVFAQVTQELPHYFWPGRFHESLPQ